MRAKRSKQYRKLMKQYALSFNFREPYQVLLDSEIILAAAKFKMHLGKLLEATLSGSIKPMITQCSMRHLYALPPTTTPEKETCISVAKAAERRRCNHHDLPAPLSTLECLLSVLDPKNSATNKHRYIVATQDAEVRARLREVPGVPLVYLKRSVMILEPMARATAEVREREERGKVRAELRGGRSVGGAVVGEKRKREDTRNGDNEEVRSEGVEGDGQVVKKRKVRGPKGPNPLSVKKAKKGDKALSSLVEDEQAVIEKAARRDPQAAEKAVHARTAVEEDRVNGVVDGARKRKRKRKPREELAGAPDGVGNNA